MINPVDEIKNRLDIVEIVGSYIKLNKAGRNYKACCPFHNEKSASLMVSSERQIWHCFGCGKGGSVFDFIMEIEGVEFGDSLRMLAQRAGIELTDRDPKITAELKSEKTKLFEICSLANLFFIKQLQEGKASLPIKEYLKDRGLSLDTIKDWHIGYAPDSWDGLLNFLKQKGYSESDMVKAGVAVENRDRNKYFDRFRDRIMFPIFNISGTIVGFTGRENPNHPNKDMGKYINTPNNLIYDKSTILFGLDKARMGIREKDACILVEGQMDVIMSHQAGFNNVVAGSGTALTELQLKIIKRYTNNLMLAYDMDMAGETAAKRGIDLALFQGLDTKIVVVPHGKDPADCIKHNAEDWKKAINDSQDLVQFYLNSALAKYKPDTAHGKKEISQAVLPIISRLTSRVEQTHWLQELSWRLKVSEEVLAEEMNSLKLPKIEYAKIESNKNDDHQSLNRRIVELAIAYPKEFKKRKKELVKLIENSDLKKVLNILTKRSKPSIEEVRRDVSSQIANRLNMIFLAIEGQNYSDDGDPEKEIEFCINQLKNQIFKKNLNNLYGKLREAEQKGAKVEVKKIIGQINKLTKAI